MARKLKKSLPLIVQCPCCDYFTFREHDSGEVCPVCFWENCGLELEEHAQFFVASKSNDGKSLFDARVNFEKFGACGQEWTKKVCTISERSQFQKKERNSYALILKLCEWLRRADIPVAESAFPFFDWWGDDYHDFSQNPGFIGAMFYSSMEKSLFCLCPPEHRDVLIRTVGEVARNAKVPIKEFRSARFVEGGVKIVMTDFALSDNCSLADD